MRLKVQNYQQARDVNIIIEGLTVLKGDSNAGKSSILKALHSAAHNRFRMGCVTWDEDVCTVMIQYTGEEDILRVERSATGASPRVKLGNKTKGYKSFSKLNRDLPQEVTAYNNFGYINLSQAEKVSLNFCTQFSPPLMVKFSNKKIVDILSYSRALSDSQNAKKWIDERNLVLKGEFNAIDAAWASTKVELGNLQKKAQKFSKSEEVQVTLDKYRDSFKKIESLVGLLESIKEKENVAKSQKKINEIVQCVSKAKTSESKIENCKNLTQILTDKKLGIRKEAALSKIYNFIVSVDVDKLSKVKQLQQLMADRSEYRKRGTCATKIVNLVQDYDVDKYAKLKELVSGLRDRKINHKAEKKALDVASKAREVVLTESIISYYKELLECLSVLGGVTKDLEDAERNRKLLVCPFCGDSIDEHNIEEHE